MPEDDPTARQIVRRNFDPDPITRQHADAEAPHVAAERREDRVGVVHRDAKGRVRQHFRDRAFELDGVLLRHVRSDDGLDRAPSGARKPEPRRTRLPLPRFARLLVIPLLAQVLEDACTNHFPLELLEHDVQPVVFADHDFNHDPSRIEGSRTKKKDLVDPRSFHVHHRERANRPATRPRKLARASAHGNRTRREVEVQFGPVPR